MKAIINATLYDFKSYKEDRYVLFENQITENGPMADFPGAEEIIDGRGCLVLPGLIVGHGHIYSTFARGWMTPFNPSSFCDILEQLWWKLDRALNLEAVYYSGLVGGAEFIRNGVTTVVDHHASGQIEGSLDALKKAVVDEMGLRGIFCFETSDRFDVEACIRENMAFAQRAQAERAGDYAGLFGMHASMTLSQETLERCGEMSGDLPIHIHVAESAEDVVDAQLYYAKRVVRRLDDAGLLKPDSILSHCIHLDGDELDILANHDVQIALNITSNMNNGVGLPDYPAFRRRDLSCIIGNDGMGFNIANEYRNFLFTMHHKTGVPTSVGLDDLKSIINNGYAYASSRLGCRLGRIETGYEADLIVVPYMAPTPIDANNAFGHLVFGMMDSFRPRDVVTKGVVRMKDYRSRMDLEPIYEKARATAQQVWKRCRP